MPPKVAEYAAKYASKTHRKSQKTTDLDQKQPFLLSIKNYIARRQMLKSLKFFGRYCLA